MPSSIANIHVVGRKNVAQNTTVSLEYSLPSLRALQLGEVRAKPVIVALTANNLTYAHGGSTLHWWDGFPVPAKLLPAYNDQAQYGVVPVWSYGQVIESKIDGLAPGQLLWGFWLTHDLPIVLQLERAGVEGHHIDNTESRSKMMSYYHRYVAQALSMGEVQGDKLDSLAWQAVYTTGEADRFISRFIFGNPPIHPLGTQTWGREDVDLTSAVGISLSASGKTARFFHDTLINERPKGTKPLALLAITASQDANLISKAAFPTKKIAQHKPSKTVIIDFRSRGNSLQVLLTKLAHSIQTKVMVLGVGAEMRAKTEDEVAAFQRGRATMKSRIQMNASGIRDKAIELMGEEAFFQEYERAWERFVPRGNIDRMMLEWGEGVAREHSIEGGWTRLCQQNVPNDVGLVYRI